MIGDTRGVWSASHRVGGGFGADRDDLAQLKRRRMSSQPSGSTQMISASGQASAMPEASPPPPQLTRSAPAAALPPRPAARGFRVPPSPARRQCADRRSSARRSQPLFAAMRAAISSRLSVRRSKKMISAPCARVPSTFSRGRVGGHDDGRRDAQPLGGDRHALRVIAG